MSVPDGNDSDGRARASSIRPAAGADVEPESDPITVLFVDDEPAILRMICRTLDGTSYTVLTAGSGREALATMRERRIDVLVSDIDMPLLDGLTLVKLTRREFPATIRMLLTAAGTMERVLAAINEGEVLRFFIKPFDPDTFRRTLTELVERIASLRAGGEFNAQQARRREFCRRIEERFPGVTIFDGDGSGEIVIDLPSALAAAQAVGSQAGNALLAGD